MIFSTMATKLMLACLMVANVARASPPIIIDEGCEPLVVGSPPDTIGEVCPEVVGDNLEVTVRITTEEGCLIIEAHICNMDIEYFSSPGVLEYTFMIDMEKAYDFTCDIGEEGTYVIAGHVTVQCDGEDPLSAYYEFEIGCPPDPTTTTPARTRPPRPATTTTPLLITTPGGSIEFETTTTTPARTRPTIPATTTTPLVITTPGGSIEFDCDDKPPCDEGTYMTEECECTDDPCDACPDGAICKGSGDDVECIDCGCGFCDSDGGACCSINAHGNNCKAESNDKMCKFQFDYYPGFVSSGNVCAGVEIGGHALNGCGCKPNSGTPCAFSQGDDPCSVCTVEDLFGKCGGCLECLKSECDGGKSSCFTDAADTGDLDKCLGDKKNDGCRKTCADACMGAVE